MKRLNRFVLHPSNDVVNAWLMSVVLFGVTIAIFGTAVIPLPHHPGHLRLHLPRDGELSGALRVAAAEER